MSFTLKEALIELARYNGDNGTCPDDPSNLSQLNRVRRLIYERGDYLGTMEAGCIAVQDNSCMYLPWQLESVRHAWIGNAALDITNMVYQTVDRNSALLESCRRERRVSVVNTGILRPIVKTPSTDFRLIVMPTNDEDEGVELVFKSVDGNGEIVRETVTVGSPFNGEFVRDVLSLVKPVTKGTIRLFGEHRDLTRSFLAEYNAEQVNPVFRQFRLSRTVGAGRVLVVVSKKRFYPITVETDLVDIESMEALAFGYQAINALNGNRTEEYVGKIQLMEEQLEEFDQNLEVSTGFMVAKPEYAEALHPRYDHGDIY